MGVFAHMSVDLRFPAHLRHAFTHAPSGREFETLEQGYKFEGIHPLVIIYCKITESLRLAPEKYLSNKE